MRDALGQDLRHAARLLARTPAFTVAALVILALGIGMATAMYVTFHAVLLETLPVHDPDRVVTLWTFRDRAVELPQSMDEINGLRRESRMLRDIAGVVHYGAYDAAVRVDDRSFVLEQSATTANFFDVLGARPVLGRLFRPEDGEDSAHVMVLSYRAWRTRFGGDPRVVGRRLEQPSYRIWSTIVGVAPPGLDYPVGTDCWFAEGPGSLPGIGFDVVARLAPNATLPAARAEFLAIAQRLDREQKFADLPTGAAIQTLPDAVLGDARPMLIALTAAVTLLLVIACVNVGNLVLLRSTLRARELVLRRALGATAGDVVRLLVVENAMLGAAGGALGLGCAEGLLRVLLALAPRQLPRTDVIRVSGALPIVVIGVTLLSTLLFGVLPAIAAARGDVGAALRADLRSGSETRRRRRARRVLVAAQVALALVMLAGAGLLVRSLARLEHLDLGYRPDHLSIVELVLPPPAPNASRADIVARLDNLYSRLRAVPGVTALTPVVIPPFLGANVWQARFETEGRSETETKALPAFAVEYGGPEYFHLFGIPILRGRGFADADRENTQPVTVISASAARRLWPGQNPIGRRLRFAGSTGWRTVVGVSGDIRYRRLRDETPTILFPWRQTGVNGFVAIRTREPLASVLPAIRRAAREIDARFDVARGETMDDYLAGPLAQPRLGAFLLSAFGMVAVLLAAIGLYAVMAFVVRERTREIGIRTALGATPDQLRRSVLGDALRTTAAGAAAGLVVALLATRTLASMLFEITAIDPATLAIVTGGLLVVGLIAAYVPARRATRIDPMQALRTE